MSTVGSFFQHRAYFVHRICALALVWLAGLSVGILLATVYPHVTVSFLRDAISTSPSPFLYFLVSGLPVVIGAVVLWSTVFLFAYPLFFLLALCRGFSGMLIYLALGSGAWLVRLLFLFSAGCTSILIWWLFLRHSTVKSPGFSKDLFLVSVFTCAVSVFDLFVVSPFLSGLSKYF